MYGLVGSPAGQGQGQPGTNHRFGQNMKQPTLSVAPLEKEGLVEGGALSSHPTPKADPMGGLWVPGPSAEALGGPWEVLSPARLSLPSPLSLFFPFFKLH